MNIFDELALIYYEIDAKYSLIELEARARGHFVKEAKYKRKKELNDQAYFLFMFTRIEDRVRILSDKLIDDKFLKLKNWSIKRTWDILYKKNKRNSDSIQFLERVALLTKLGQNDYNLIDTYYKQRNNIAHGKTFTIPINISTVVNDMKRLYFQLR